MAGWHHVDHNTYIYGPPRHTNPVVQKYLNNVPDDFKLTVHVFDTIDNMHRWLSDQVIDDISDGQAFTINNRFATLKSKSSIVMLLCLDFFHDDIIAHEVAHVALHAYLNYYTPKYARVNSHMHSMQEPISYIIQYYFLRIQKMRKLNYRLE